MIIAALYLRAEAAEAAALKARHDVLASAELRGERLEPASTAASAGGRGCGCDACAAAPLSAPVLTKTAVNKMTRAPVRLAELAAHGQGGVGTAAVQVAALKSLADRKALHLTKEESPAAPQPTVRPRDDDAPLSAARAPPSSPTKSINTGSPTKQPPRKRLAAVPSPVFTSPLAPRRTRRATQRFGDSPMAVSSSRSPSSPMAASSPSRAHNDIAQLIPALLLSDLKLEKLTPYRSEGYAWACDFVLRSHILTWNLYETTAQAMKVYVLTEKEFNLLLDALFILVTSLLDEWLLHALDVIEAAYATARRRRTAFRWPLYAGAGYVLQADACFQIVGYQSPHATVHAVDSFTQLPCCRTHLTKHKLPSYFEPLQAAHVAVSVAGILTNSGDMDWFGTTEALAWLHNARPRFLVRSILTRDGDVKGHPVSTLVDETLRPDACVPIDAGCYTHEMKNLHKFADKSLPKEDCMCTSKSNKNHRFTAPMPQQLHAWVYHLLDTAERYYLPEKYMFRVEGTYPASVTDEERGVRRQAAIDHMCRELDVVVAHFTGDHKHCSHGALPADKQFFCCTAQIDALTRYLGQVKRDLPRLLSPVGKVHVQYVESNHAIIARWRKKGTKMSATASFLGESLALLSILELQLAANGSYRSSLTELSALVLEQLGLSFEVDVDRLMASLDKRLRRKMRRATAQYRKKVSEQRARGRAKLAKNKRGTSGAYATGGTSEALDAAVAARA